MAFTPRTPEYYDSVESASGTVSVPSGTQDGDILFAFIGWKNMYTADLDVPPGGWTLLGSSGSPSSQKYFLYYRIASSEPANYTWATSYAPSYPGQLRIVMLAYTGGDFDAADPIDVTSNTAYATDNTTVRAAGMSVFADASPMVYFGAVFHSAAVSFTKPSDIGADAWTEDDDSGSTNSYFHFSVDSMIRSDSGATGDMDATSSVSTTTKHAFAVALNPAAGSTYNESLTLAIGAALGRSGIAAMNAGISLGVSAGQGTGSVAEVDAVIALSLAMAMLQEGSVDVGPQTYEEAAILAAAMGMSQLSLGSLQEAVTLAAAAGMGLSGQSILINALVLQATASMIQSSVGSLSASINMDVSMSEAFGTALILQASVLFGAASGLSASGGLSIDDTASLEINTGMAQFVAALLSAAVGLNAAVSQTPTTVLTAEAQIALSIACEEIDSIFSGTVYNVSAALSVVAGMQPWGIVPQIAAAKHLYDALARKREYDAKERKRDHDATPRKREYDTE